MRIVLLKKGVQDGVELKPQLLYYCCPLPIKKPKVDDLRIIVSRYVPTEYQEFYSELPTCGESDSSDEDDQ